MRLWVLHEATVEQIQRRIPMLIQKYFRDKDEREALEVIEQLAEIDPTHGKYVDWLVRNYIAGHIILPEDAEKTHELLKRHMKVKGKLKPIDEYVPSSLARAIDELPPEDFISARKAKELGRRGQLVPVEGAKHILSKGHYDVVEIKTSKAASILCSGTEWCVANEPTAEEYLAKGPLYLVYKNKQSKYLAHYDGGHVKIRDIYDGELEPKDRFYIIDLLEEITGINKTNSPQLAYEYACDVIGGRWSEAEDVIRQDPIWAYGYARHVIKGRWPEGEETIRQNPKWAYYYAYDVMRRRWSEAEEIIKQEPQWAYWYACYVMKERWPEGEDVIRQDPKWAYGYARHVIKGRWPQAEEVIRQDPKWWKEYKFILARS